MITPPPMIKTMGTGLLGTGSLGTQSLGTQSHGHWDARHSVATPSSLLKVGRVLSTKKNKGGTRYCPVVQSSSVQYY